MKDKQLLILIAVVGVILIVPIAGADVPTMISYQGVLLDSEGDPVTTPVNVTFTIYDSPSEGAISWQETQAVGFDASGRFDVSLGETTPITDDVFSDPVRWLGVQVEGDAELVPRTRIVSVAYANRISTVDGATGGTISGDVIIQSNLSVDGDISATGKATIGPGHTNTGLFTFVVGQNNSAAGDNSTISGGKDNSADGQESTVGGGNFNNASGLQSTIAGGYAGDASGESSTVGGGWHNTASGIVSTVSGGQENIADGILATVSGGQGNTASGPYAAIPGGLTNSAIGPYSLAAGYRAKANHVGAFVWGDQTDADFASTGAGQFLIRATGGVGIGTNNPTAALEVQGEVKSIVAGVNFYMVPQGAIIMWSGLLANIPSGWALCDGSNGTPNLSDRFIYSVHGGENPGAVGGSATIPSHNHTINIGPFQSSPTGFTWLGCPLFGGPSEVADYRHTHTVDPPATMSTSDGSTSIIPPYFKLALIMKL